MSLKNKALGYYVGLLGGIAAVIALAFYINYGNMTGQRNMLVIVPLVCVIALQIVSIFFENDLLIMAAPALCMIPLGAFLFDSVGTIVDYVFNLTLYGDVSQIGNVARMSVITGIGVIVLLVSTFMKRQKA